MKLDTALNAIERALEDALETEIKNIFGNMGNPTAQTKELETGFDRVNAFETLALEVARRKFKP